MRRIVLAVCVGGLCLLAGNVLGARSALAQPALAAPGDELTEDPRVAEARALFERGRELAEQRRFSEASLAFERSLSLVDRPSTAFNLAVTLYALGRHVEAIAALERYEANASPVDEGQDYVEAQQMLAHARASVAQIVIDVVPADARVVVDGVAVQGDAERRVTVNPGTHVLRVEAEGFAPQLLELATESGVQLRRAVQLASTRRLAQLEVEVADRPDATIVVDGREVGQGSARLEVEPGRHLVRIAHPDMLAFDRSVDVDYNDRLLLTVTTPVAAHQPTIFEEPGLWVGVGVGVAAAAIAIAVGLVASQPPQPGGGSTGVILMPTPAVQAGILP